MPFFVSGMLLYLHKEISPCCTMLCFQELISGSFNQAPLLVGGGCEIVMILLVQDQKKAQKKKQP